MKSVLPSRTFKNAPAGQNFTQPACDSFDFWQFWHTSILLRWRK